MGPVSAGQVLMVGAASVGYLWVPMAWYERILAIVGAFMLVVASALTDQIGFALCALVLLVHWRRRRAA